MLVRVAILPPSFPFLLHKQATSAKRFEPKCIKNVIQHFSYTSLQATIQTSISSFIRTKRFTQCTGAFWCLVISPCSLVVSKFKIFGPVRAIQKCSFQYKKPCRYSGPIFTCLLRVKKMDRWLCLVPNVCISYTANIYC